MVSDARSKAPDKLREGRTDPGKNEKRLRRKRKHDQILNLPEPIEGPVEASNTVSRHSNKKRRTRTGEVATREDDAAKSVATMNGNPHEPELPTATGPSPMRSKKNRRAEGVKKPLKGTKSGTSGPLVDKDQSAEPPSSITLKNGVGINQDVRAPKFIVFIGQSQHPVTTSLRIELMVGRV